MRFLKKTFLIDFINGLIIDLPAASNLSYKWNLGSILGLILMIQIVSGILLACHYIPNINYAFDSIEHITRNLTYGWLLRYIHANGATVFFFFTYTHIARGIYYGAYYKPRFMLWLSGIIILLILMAIAFLGYVLVWGSMSLWGAVVITSMVSAIPFFGSDIVYWLWGGFSVSNSTLNRFYSLHYFLPFLLAALIFIHLLLLHMFGSNNPLGLNRNNDLKTFLPYYTSKDILGIIVFIVIFSILIFYTPNGFADPDNFLKANPLITPLKIKPEIYFLWAYAILRSIPNKLGGVLLMGLAILILLILPLIQPVSIKSNLFKPLAKLNFWCFIYNWMFLTTLGGSVAEQPYIIASQVSSIYYFSFFIIFNFMVINLEKKLFFWFNIKA